MKTVTAVVCISFATPCINGCTVNAPLEDLAFEGTVVTKSDEPVIVIRFGTEQMRQRQKKIPSVVFIFQMPLIKNGAVGFFATPLTAGG